jgi:hypothetical protein
MHKFHSSKKELQGVHSLKTHFKILFFLSFGYYLLLLDGRTKRSEKNEFQSTSEDGKKVFFPQKFSHLKFFEAPHEAGRKSNDNHHRRARNN